MYGKAGDGRPPEERFFAATCMHSRNTPPWLIRIERTTPHMDVKGVDAFALVRYPLRPRLVRIPIQIKGSEEGLFHYFEEHRWAKEARVIGIAITQTDNDEYIRQKLYRDLNVIRGCRFNPREILEQLQKDTLNTRGVEYAQKILTRRRGEPSMEYYRRPTTRWRTRLAQWFF
jgi:hypothetical protein